MLLSYLNKNLIEAGCDEAGRGCLCGPVFAAAVILSNDFKNNLLRDSKKIKEKDRYKLRNTIINEAIDWAVAMVDNNTIDQINILWASVLAMHKAIEKLNIKPEHLIIDGNRFKPYKDIPYTCIVKGDDKYLSIAAASILAKTYRDEYMNKLHEEYPQYGWNKNKGYPTIEHRKAIEKYGITQYHRKSFKLTEQQLSLNFE
jgi:ribonuclease HII